MTKREFLKSLVGLPLTLLVANKKSNLIGTWAGIKRAEYPEFKATYEPWVNVGRRSGKSLQTHLDIRRLAFIIEKSNKEPWYL